MKRDDIVSQMEAMHNLTISESRGFTVPEQTQWDGLIAQVRHFDQLAEVVAAPAVPANPTRTVGAPALHLTQRSNHADLLRGAVALAIGERSVDVGLASEFDRETRRRNPTKTFQGVAMSLKSLLLTKASDIGALGGGLAVDATGTQFMDSLYYRQGDTAHGPRLADALGVNTVVASEATVHVTKLTGTVTPTWIARDGDVPQSDATFEADEISPRSIGTQITLKRSALLYAVHPQVAPLMNQELRDAVHAALDDAVLFGPGGLAPVGVQSLAASGHSLSTLADSYLIRNQLFSYIKSADPIGAKWLIEDLTEGRFVTQAAYSGATAPSILGGTLAGFPYVLRPVSGAGSPAPTATYMFGDWSYVHLVLWDSVSLLANPFGSQFASGGIDVRVLCDANSYVRDSARLVTGSAAALSA